MKFHHLAKPTRLLILLLIVLVLLGFGRFTLTTTAQDSAATFPHINILIEQLNPTPLFDKADNSGLDVHYSHGVGISGNLVVIGAPGENSRSSNNDTGAIYIFERYRDGDDGFRLIQRIPAPNEGIPIREFGHAVAIEGETIVVGAPGSDANSNYPDGKGAVFIFERRTGNDQFNDDNNPNEFVRKTNGQGRFGSAVALDNDTLVIGAEGSTTAGSQQTDGEAYVLHRNEGGKNNWGLITQLTTALNLTSGAQFGHSVDISGDVIVVGAPEQDLDTNDGVQSEGVGFIFHRNANNADGWGNVDTIRADNSRDNRFGTSVAVEGDLVVAGARFADASGHGSGEAYIFERNVGGVDGYGLIKQLLPANPEVNDKFGQAVAVWKDTVIVGGQNSPAIVYQRNAGKADYWGQTAVLASGFIKDIDIDNGVAVVGTLFGDIDGGSVDNTFGAAFAYERVAGEEWREVAQPEPVSYKPNFGSYGTAVDIDGDVAVVGASGEYGNSFVTGEAYVLARNAGGIDAWNVIATLVQPTRPNNVEQDDYYGVAVAISDNLVAVGAPATSSGLEENPGIVYIFERNEDRTVQGTLVEGDGYGLLATLYSPDRDGNTDTHGFGTAIALDGGTLVVSRPDDTSDEKGVVYIFERNEGGANAFGLVKKITADSNGGDFGRSVALDNEVLVIGAPIADASNGTQGGLVYIRERDKGGKNNWGKVVEFESATPSDLGSFGEQVVIDSNLVVVSEPGAESFSVYERNYTAGGYQADNWGLVYRDVGNPFLDVGPAIALEGTTIAIRQSAEIIGESVLIYQPTGDLTTFELSTSVPVDRPNGDDFGAALALSGDFLLVGAPQYLGGPSNGYVTFFKYGSADAPQASVADPAPVEEGAGMAVVTVTLDSSAETDITVNYSMSDGTASADDYTAQSGSVTFATGETAKTIDIPIIDDDEEESAENFIVTISSTEIHVSDDHATVTIAASDFPPTGLCAVEMDGDDRTDFASDDSQALRDAVAAAAPNDTLRVAGTCAGVVLQHEPRPQIAYIDKSLTIIGGYEATGWTQVTNTTSILDGINAGRGLVITNTATVTLTHLTISNTNSGSNHGGGIYNTATVILDNVLLQNNRAPSGGGGMFSIGTAIVRNSTVTGNFGGGSGGGIHNNGGTLSVINSTLSGNSSAWSGAAIHNRPGGVLTVTHSTIVSNTSRLGSTTTGVGAIYSGGASNVQHSIVANNSIDGDISADRADCRIVTDGGYNIFGEGTGCSADSGTSQTVTPGTLLVEPLADNGSPTPTHALTQFSAARDFGPAFTCALTTDQRGISRPQNTYCDAGAVEMAAVGNCFAHNPTTAAVYGSEDQRAIQWAIDDASDGAALRLAGRCSGVSFYEGTFQMAVISRSLSLQGGYTTTNWTVSDPATHPTVLDGLGMGRIFYITDSVDVTINAITTVNAAAVEEGEFPNPFTIADGGAIYAHANVTVTHSTLITNVAVNGGAIASAPGFTLTLDDVTVRDSLGLNDGGALDVGDGGTLTMRGSTLIDNSADDDGGAVHLGLDSDAVIEDSLLQWNFSADDGGALRTQGSVTLSNTVVISNYAEFQGGGINNDDGALVVYSSTLTANEADEGGAIYSDGTLTVTGSILASNVVTDSGGAITARSALTLRNSTLSGNVSLAGSGGGLLVASPAMSGTAQVLIEHTTIVSNSAASDGGGVAFSAETSTALQMTLSATILAGNSGGDCVQLAGSADVVPQTDGYNLLSGAVEDDCPIGASDLSLTDLNMTIDDVVEPLVDGYHPLADGSPAIDAIPHGACLLAVDQRGIGRPQGGACDIGAVEMGNGVPTAVNVREVSADANTTLILLMVAIFSITSALFMRRLCGTNLTN